MREKCVDKDIPQLVTNNKDITLVASNEASESEVTLNNSFNENAVQQLKDSKIESSGANSFNVM